jgi:hypothetical protein
MAEGLILQVAGYRYCRTALIAINARPHGILIVLKCAGSALPDVDRFWATVAIKL